jgi:hypothetical protein
VPGFFAKTVEALADMALSMMTPFRYASSPAKNIPTSS